MKNKLIYMFFALQLLIILTNYQNINSSIFSISILDILKIIITTYCAIYIFFIAKNSINKKIVYSSVMFFSYVTYLYNDTQISQLFTDFYYISTFSFILFFFINNKIDRFKTLFLFYFILLIFDVALLFNHQSGITIEILLLIFLAIVFGLFYNHKKMFVPVYLLTLLVAVLNNLNFILYNSLIISLIVMLDIHNKKNIINGLLLFGLSTIILLFNNILSISSLSNTINILKINSSVTSLIILIPILFVISYLITRYIVQKENQLDMKVCIYIATMIAILMMISLDNVYNELIIISFAFLIVLLIDRINNYKRKLKKEITFFVLHLGYGGIESSTINTANELLEYYRVNIVSFYNLNRNIEDTIDNRIKIKHLYNGEPNKKELIEAIKNRQIANTFKEGFKAAYILLLKEYLVSKEMYECNSMYVVSTRNEFSILLSEYGNKRAIKIAQEHMHHRDNKNYINNIKYKFNNINYMFALTKSLKDDYEIFLKDNKNTKVVIVPNIIYLPKKKTKLKSKNFITISRLNNIKRLDDMINMFSKIDNKKSKLYIIGDGEELDKLKKLTNDLELYDRVIFTGYKTKEEMEEYILDSSVFLLTSWSEGLPMVLLEAMSYGIPCIAFKTKSGVSDIIDNNVNGYIIEGRNKEKYIEKMNELVDNKKLLNEFSKKSIEKSKKFTSKVIIKKWQEVLDNEKEK